MSGTIFFGLGGKNWVKLGERRIALHMSGGTTECDAWLAEHGGAHHPAPAKQGNPRHPPVGAAPGRYVVEQVD
jgi:hypothetical protein